MIDKTGSPISRRSFLVALGLVVLTAAAVLIPPLPAGRGDGTLLALLPVTDHRRSEALADLADYLSREIRLDLRVESVTDRDAFAAALSGALLAFCPDAVALRLPAASWQAVAVGRRRVPSNQWPASVLVSRSGRPPQKKPWRTVPARTVFGDSLSQACLVPLCEDGLLRPLPAKVGWGRDPYDHRAVLAAAAHGAYDHAVVREWDAAMAVADGLLDSADWRQQRLCEPLLDVVVSVSRRLSGPVRLELQEALMLLGRDGAELSPATRLVQAQLGHFGLDGFNLLLGPEVERQRRLYHHCQSGSAP